MTQTVNIDSAITRAVSVYSPTTQQSGFNSFMTQLYQTDLENVFFNSLEFAEVAMIYHSDLGTWESYSVLFEDPTIQAQTVGDIGVIDLQPKATIQESQLMNPIRKDDLLQVRGITYFVEDINSDGYGVIEIDLKRKDR